MIKIAHKFAECDINSVGTMRIICVLITKRQQTREKIQPTNEESSNMNEFNSKAAMREATTSQI